MATKAEVFKAQKQRQAKPPKPKTGARPRRDSDVDTAKQGVSATDRKAAVGSSGSRNESKRAGRRGGAALEGTPEGRRPSRKSTRGSAGRIKRASNLQRKAVRKASAPKTRARKAQARAKKR